MKFTERKFVEATIDVNAIGKDELRNIVNYLSNECSFKGTNEIASLDFILWLPGDPVIFKDIYDNENVPSAVSDIMKTAYDNYGKQIDFVSICILKN